MANARLEGAASRGLLISPATPALVSLIDAPAGADVGAAQVEVLTPFDGAPTVKLGTAGDPELVLSAAEVDLARAGRYLSPALITLSSAESIRLTFDAGGATVGSARLVFRIGRGG